MAGRSGRSEGTSPLLSVPSDTLFGMAYDEDLSDRIRVAIQREDGVTEKRMFGGLAFLVDGNMAVAASSQGGLLLRVDPDDLESFLAPPHVEPFEMRGARDDRLAPRRPGCCRVRPRPPSLGGRGCREGAGAAGEVAAGAPTRQRAARPDAVSIPRTLQISAIQDICMSPFRWANLSLRRSWRA